MLGFSLCLLVVFTESMLHIARGQPQVYIFSKNTGQCQSFICLVNFIHSNSCILHPGFDLHFPSDLMKKAMTTHSSILAWKIPWAEEPGRLQSMGL